MNGGALSEVQLRPEERTALFLNNSNEIGSIRCLRPPNLANEIIKTHQELIIMPPPAEPKRLKTRDAGI